jgi:hypothetical protein
MIDVFKNTPLAPLKGGMLKDAGGRFRSVRKGEPKRAC